MVEHQRELRRAGDRRSLAFCFVIGVLAALPLRAADIWIIRGSAGARAGDCPGVRWSADALLHNRSATDATLHVVHVSNDGGATGTSATVVAHESVSASATGIGGTANAALWVAKLDVPPNVSVEGRLEYFAVSCNPGSPPNMVPSGKLALPVAHSLVPAGEEQVHFGTDLGGQAVRLNVAIYNAGAVPANVVVMVHQPVCHAVPSTTNAVVPADSIVQVSIPQVPPCTINALSPDWASYVTVTVDQPSFSFVSTLSNTQAPGVTTAVVP